jgi:AcrR family transcriptional regulator
MAPRTKEQVERLREEKREFIMNEALELFAEEGYHSTTISKIARKADISKGLLYNYFESKEDLIRAIVYQFMDEMLSMVDQNNDGVVTDEEFKTMIDQYFIWAKREHQKLKLLFALMFQPAVYKLVEDKLMEMAVPTFTLLANYFESKGLENPMAEARYFNSLTDGIIMNYVVDPDNFPLELMHQKLLKQYKPLYSGK